MCKSNLRNWLLLFQKYYFISPYAFAIFRIKFKNFINAVLLVNTIFHNSKTICNLRPIAVVFFLLDSAQNLILFSKNTTVFSICEIVMMRAIHGVYFDNCAELGFEIFIAYQPNLVHWNLCILTFLKPHWENDCFDNTKSEQEQENKSFSQWSETEKCFMYWDMVMKISL